MWGGKFTSLISQNPSAAGPNPCVEELLTQKTLTIQSGIIEPTDTPCLTSPVADRANDSVSVLHTCDASI